MHDRLGVEKVHLLAPGRRVLGLSRRSQLREVRWCRKESSYRRRLGLFARDAGRDVFARKDAIGKRSLSQRCVSCFLDLTTTNTIDAIFRCIFLTDWLLQARKELAGRTIV